MKSNVIAFNTGAAERREQIANRLRHAMAGQWAVAARAILAVACLLVIACGLVAATLWFVWVLAEVMS